MPPNVHHRSAAEYGRKIREARINKNILKNFVRHYINSPTADCQLRLERVCEALVYTNMLLESWTEIVEKNKFIIDGRERVYITKKRITSDLLLEKMFESIREKLACRHNISIFLN